MEDLEYQVWRREQEEKRKKAREDEILRNSIFYTPPVFAEPDPRPIMTKYPTGPRVIPPPSPWPDLGKIGERVITRPKKKPTEVS